MSSKPTKKQISAVMSTLGKRTSKKKKLSSRANALKGAAAVRTSDKNLERAQKAFESGKMPLTRAAREIGHCSVITLRKYIEEQEGCI